MIVKENVLLKNETTMRVGGPARFFVEVHNLQELKDAVLEARQHGLPIFILGDGSNIVVGDKGINAFVIKLKTKGVEFEELDGGSVRVIAMAGENWDALVAETVSRNLHGLENLSLIPGIVGAAPIQNIGAYGTDVSETIEWVRVLNTKTMSEETLAKAECEFRYRDSIFKRPESQHLIVTVVAFKLTRDGTPKADYKDVKAWLAEKRITSPTIQDIRRAVVEIRSAKLPYPHQVGTVGSFFKNPVVSKEKYEKLLTNYTDMPGFPAPGGIKIPAAWLIDKVCGCRGVRKGNVGTHERQALAIVHYGGGTAREIKIFAEEIRKKVFERTEIELEYEVAFVGTA